MRIKNLLCLSVPSKGNTLRESFQSILHLLKFFRRNLTKGLGYLLKLLRDRQFNELVLVQQC